MVINSGVILLKERKVDQACFNMQMETNTMVILSWMESLDMGCSSISMDQNMKGCGKMIKGMDRVVLLCRMERF